jgi:branched-chain amino acid:cation transporter, LIVCS family
LKKINDKGFKMSSFFKKRTLCAGAAIFSMFFGAGNVIFPIKLGLGTGSQLSFALIGLLITGIGGPMLGLLTALRYKGESRLFFSRWGALSATLFLSLSLALLGPFCVLPRCYIVAHAAALPFIPELPRFWFFCGMALISFFCTMRKGFLLSILGTYLAPLLLISLVAIIFAGILQGGFYPESTEAIGDALMRGAATGYDTMDLIAAIIFSGSIWGMLHAHHQDEEELYATAWRASLIAGILLGLVYSGLAVVAALYSDQMNGVAPEALLSSLAVATLGPTFAGVANVAVMLACLTTVIGLTSAIARILFAELFTKKINETMMIALMAVLSVCFANFGFSAIQTLLHPVVSVAYPVMIVLAFANLWEMGRNMVQTEIT